MFMFVVPPLLSLSLLLPASFASGTPLYITSADDFIAFSTNVLNDGTNYVGETVFLANDIDFSGSSSQFKPIGNATKYFLGTFDGQGHKISNLVFNSSSFRHAGLFGYSKGLTIRNLVIDSTCSFTNSHKVSKYYNVFVGGLIGCCDAIDGPCISENNVNMASVTFAGSTTRNAMTGGIGGMLYSYYANEIVIRNCINYGDITFSGTSGNFSELGGIAADVSEEKETTMPAAMYLQNCANYGTITYNGSAEENGGILMGGVLGINVKLSKIENCVNSGVISMVSSGASDKYTGNIVGNVRTNLELVNCYWTEWTGCDKLHGKKNSSAVVTVKGSSQISDYSGTINALNKYNTAWNRWVYNANSVQITFNINKGAGFTFTSSKLILLPSLAESSGLTFSGWYTDSSCNNEFAFTSTTISTSSSISLYGGWVYTLTYNGNGGTPPQPSKSVVYGQLYGTLSGTERDGYTFLGWYTTSSGGDKVESNTKVTIANNHTLYAHWKANNYTVTFNISKTTIIQEEHQFNDTIEYPTNIPEMEGYMFVGWDKNITAMPGHNITINAVWSKVTEYVKIVFGTKGLTEDEIEDIIKKYAGSNSDFTIVGFENKPEGVKVIVKFINKEDAKTFINSITESIGSQSLITRVGYTTFDGYFDSFALSLFLPATSLLFVLWLF